MRDQSTHRRSRGWMFLAAAIVTEVTGTLSLKGALGQPLLYLVVIVAFLSAFGCLAQALRAGIGLGVAYGIWGAAGVALTAIGSLLVFDEPLTPLMATGIVVIIAGVLCIELGSQAAHRSPEGSA